MTLNTTTWQQVVKKKWKTTTEFKNLDRAVTAYIGGPAIGNNLGNMRTAWNAWIAKFPASNYKQSDRYTNNCALDDIARIVNPQQGAVPAPVPAPLQAQMALQARAALQQREARVQSQYVEMEIEQTYDGQPGPLSWWVKFTFEERATTLIVKPVICIRAKPGDPKGYRPTDTDLNRWKQQIQGAWKGKFMIGQTQKDVAFDIDFRPWDASTGDRNYKVDVVNISIQSAQEQNLGIAQGTLQAQNWRVKQDARNMTLDGSSLGTPHLNQWGAQDMQAIVHEFGHAIGNPDEYDVVSHNINFGGHQGLNYNKQGFTTDSIMNDTKDGLIRKRHFAVVIRMYQDWKVAQNGGPAPMVSVLDPKA